MRTPINRARGTARIALVAASLALFTARAFAVQPGDVDLSPTPPDLDASVDPNIVVSFDDSGSMASNFMGDNRPFDDGSWSGPWRCAGVIGGSSPIANHAMNGVYYNPNVLYVPPVYEDGTSFPNADASLAAVWLDGIAANRPVNGVGANGTIGYNNNPNSGADASDSGRTRISSASGANCSRFRSDGTCSGTDHRWTCGWSTSPLDTVHTDPETGAAYPNGGPYYYRLKSSVTIPVDAFGNPTSTGISRLYTASNWEAVAVPNSNATIQGVTVNQWQNFANWYAYYRTRNIMTRSALSRTFGQFGDNVRVAWQTIWPFCSRSCSNGGSWGVAIDNSTIITNLNNTQTGAAANYRKSFFNFLFQVGARGNTPDRAATIRAGEFFRRPLSNDLKDPYFQPDTRNPPGRELSCRQNFHMLVTDGYWNEGNPTVPSGFFDVQSSHTLPDSTAFTRGDAESRVFWDVPSSSTGSCGSDGSTNCYPSLADIAFFYWAKDLRTDLDDTVPPYVPDKTTGITGSTPLTPGQDPLSNKEIYFNPVNDPAKWQHVVQFMVTLGIAGNLQFSDDIDCSDPNNDLCKLRKGQQNSSGITGWPRPARNRPEAIDDTWHAAINSRGSYFSASDPSALVQHLTDIINNILSRRGSSTALSATMSTLTSGTQGYSAGYDTSDYSGFLTKQDLDPVSGTPGTLRWDAGCILTGGFCVTSGATGGAARDPNTRVIFTSNDAGTGGRLFRWADLSSSQQAALNQDPASSLVCTTPTGVAPGCDGNGQARLDWLRGVRTSETVAPLLRKRSSVLGAIINSQPRYVSAPIGGFSDNFPPGSPEAIAATPGSNGAPGAGSYAQFVYDNRNRAPTVYVGSNDGMLHAFDGVTGAERWAYVPSLLLKNGHLDKITDESYFKTAPGVDNTPVIQDVFINGSWHTVLVGSLRLGGRGIFALDITAPDGFTDSTAPAKVLWEISNTTVQGGSTPFAHLGYTYSYPNIARLSNGKWVVLVASGYFPLPNQTPVDPASNDPAANQTSLFVIDLETGNLISEISTASAPQPAPPQTYGLSSPAVYDLNSDLVDDIAVAGDLAGNLWRFDLRDTSNFRVDLMFKSYGNNTADIGRMPISVMPVGMRDRAANLPIWVFGTGKYLGLCDRTASTPPTGCGADSNTATQAFYGVRDYGNGTEAAAAGVTYPFTPAMMNRWTITQDSGGVRTLTPALSLSVNRGWTIPLNVTAEPGERNIVTAVPFYSANYVILTTLIPKGDDPCDPGRRGAIMVVDGALGGPLPASPLGGGAGPTGGGNDEIGKVVDSNAIPIAGIPAVVGSQGGPLLLPGLPEFAIPAPPPHRGSWRELLDLL
jgi:type IV pilus assembly protein PilY1